MSQLRFVHTVASNVNVDIWINQQPAFLNLGYGQVTAYQRIESTQAVVTVKIANTDTTLTQACYDLDYDQSSTVIISGLVSDLATIRLDAYSDDNRCPTPGLAKLRFIHGAASVPPVNVLVGSTIIFNQVKYLSTGRPEYLQVPPGFASVSVALSSNNQVVVGPVNLPIAAGGNYTVVAAGLAGNQQFPPTGILIASDPFKCDQLEPDFDLAAYMGRWWQIASIPQPFAQGCQRQIAEYTLLDSGVKVVNRCLNLVGQEITQIVGRAEQVVPAAFIVTFPQVPLPPVVNYLVHQSDYMSYALVGSPDRSSLFILSRDARMKKSTYRHLVRQARELGYNIRRLVIDTNALK